MRRHLALGKGEDQIAVTYNCSVATVRDTLAPLDSPKVMQDAIEARQITLTHAKALAKLKPEEQRAKVADLVAAGKNAKPHQRSHQQASVMGERPRVKSSKQIQAAQEASQGDYAAALRWVLGEEEGAAPVERDSDGYWTHPAHPEFEEGQDAEAAAWFNAQKLQTHLAYLEGEAEDHPAVVAYWGDAGDSNISPWEPPRPKGEGWFVLSIHDTEDWGPVCVWARPAALPGKRAAMRNWLNGAHRFGSAWAANCPRVTAALQA